MKRTASILAVCLIVVGLILSNSSAQAGRFRDEPPPAPDGRSEAPVIWGSPGLDSTYTQPEIGQAADFALGQPGFSMAYSKMFGVTDEPYPADTAHLNRPNGLWIDGSNNVYVAEDMGARVIKYNPAGSALRVFGEAGLNWHGDGFLPTPKDLAQDADGNLWILGTPAVQEYDPAGNFIQIFPASEPWIAGDDNGRFDNPHGIAFDSTGRMFIADTDNHRIQIFSFDVDGNPVYVETIGVTGVSGNDATHFNRPIRLVFDDSDRLYVADFENSRVQRCADTGSWVCETFDGTGIPGDGIGELSNPHGLGKDHSGNILIADLYNNRIKKCPISGGSCTILVTGIDFGLDVDVDSAGNFYVSDFTRAVVRKFGPTGTSLGVFAGTAYVPYVPDSQRINSPWGLAATPDGGFVVTEEWGYRLVKYNAAGSQAWTVGEAGVRGDDNNHFTSWWSNLESQPAVDANGRIYVPDTSNNRVQIYNADGSFYAHMGQNLGGGTDNANFNCPTAAAIHPVNGDIYITDHCNHRIQVFTSARVYKTTIGVTDTPGADNSHFNLPHKAAVDRNGIVFVADSENSRVQKCTPSGLNYTCTTFAGVTGEYGYDYGHLHPSSVAVDAAGRVYVTDDWWPRVLVYDSAGAFLTVVAGFWGPNTGQLRDPLGLAVDASGNLYIADKGNHRVLKYRPGPQGWKQVNLNGFGDVRNYSINTLAVFGGNLYAGTGGAQIWRMNSSGVWTGVKTDGFGNPEIYGVRILYPYGGKLYAGLSSTETNGGELWRSDTGQNWTPVVQNGFDDLKNRRIYNLGGFNSALYATTTNSDSAGGLEIWRSPSGNSGTWTKVVEHGFDGNLNNTSGTDIRVYQNMLYVGTDNTVTGAELWRSASGNSGSWIQVNADGFGEGQDNGSVTSLQEFKGNLYASTSNCNAGGQVWRSLSGNLGTWTKVVNAGFGDVNNCTISNLTVQGGFLFANTYNHPWNTFYTGMEVWRTSDGIHWTQFGPDGLGDSNNQHGWDNHSMVVFNNRLYVGTYNELGAEVWWLLDQIFLPFTLR